MPGPLDGIRVFDLARILAGPTCTQLLGDLGADVIKIERPGAGDLSRSSITDDPDGLDNPVFRSLNRNKRSIALDLRGEAGKAVVFDLAKNADVVVENFRPDVKKRLGIDYKTLSKINPKLIYASISGFGQDGPYANRPKPEMLA